MLEYVLSLGAMLVLFSILAGLVAVTVKYSARTENLVACEYP